MATPPAPRRNGCRRGGAIGQRGAGSPGVCRRPGDAGWRRTGGAALVEPDAAQAETHQGEAQEPGRDRLGNGHLGRGVEPGDTPAEGHLAELEALERAAAAISLNAAWIANQHGTAASFFTAVAKLSACDLAEEAVRMGFADRIASSV